MVCNVKRPRAISSSSVSLLEADTNTQAPTSALSPDAHAAKKLKLLAKHHINSPFPDYSRPSAEETRAIHALLASHMPADVLAPVGPAPLTDAKTCGLASNVLDALISTILSQNTTSSNSSRAKRLLDDTFGCGEAGFSRMADADLKDLAKAIESGGLANRKAEAIREALRAVKARHGRYDLQHLQGLTDEEVMQELVSLKGVGPKTAACVLSFCLGRQVFAVDTHVFRLVKLLGWVPQHADRVSAQAHLELMIPPELKFGLHVMMVRHGRLCRGCKNRGKEHCPLKAWLKERHSGDDVD